MIRYTTMLVALWVLSVVGSRAAAQDASSEMDARARLHFDAGTDYFDRGDYEHALQEFELAHEMSGRGELLYNLGATYERMGRAREAADQFEAYVAAVPDAVNAVAVRERAQRLRERADAEAATTETTEITDPGTVEPPDDDPTHATSDGGGNHPHPAGFVVLGAGVLGLATFAVLGGLALAEDGALAAECGTACAPSRVATLDAMALGADISLGIGAALAIAGTVMLFTVTEPDAAPVAVAITPGGLAASGRF